MGRLRTVAGTLSRRMKTAGMRGALGLFAGACFALTASPSFADSIPPKVDTTTPWGMNAADAQFRFDVTDLSIGPLTLERFTQSPSKYWPDLSQFGMLMTSNFDIYVMGNSVAASGPPYNIPQHYHANVHIGNSSVGMYWIGNPLTSGTIRNDNLDSYAGSLTRSGTALVFTDKDGNVYTFNPSVSANATGGSYGPGGRASQRVDHINYVDGRVRQFSYDSSQRLKLVTDSTGYAILFDYGANGMVADACGIDLAVTFVTSVSTCTGQPLKVSYQYGTIATQYAGGAAPVLVGFTDVSNETTTYTPGLLWGSPAVACIKLPHAGTCKSQLTSDENGFHQTLADQTTWTVLTESDPRVINDPEYAGSDPQFYSWVLNPAGNLTSYVFYLSAPLSIEDGNGHTTSYKWCCSQLEEIDAPQTLDGTLLTEVDYPEGNKYLARYDGPYNRVSEQRWVAKPDSGLADRVVSYGYTTGYLEPTSKIDVKGNVTNLTYKSFQAIESEMQPAPSSGAARPLKRYDYVQKSAWIKNSGGTLVSTGQPIWLPSTETVCQTLAGSNPSATCDPAAPQTITTYQYGADGTADNLLLHGKAVASGGTTLRTCYSYDAYSRKISETTPNANLSVCP